MVGFIRADFPECAPEPRRVVPRCRRDYLEERGNWVVMGVLPVMMTSVNRFCGGSCNGKVVARVSLCLVMTYQNCRKESEDQQQLLT